MRDTITTTTPSRQQQQHLQQLHDKLPAIVCDEWIEMNLAIILSDVEIAVDCFT